MIASDDIREGDLWASRVAGFLVRVLSFRAEGNALVVAYELIDARGVSRGKPRKMTARGFVVAYELSEVMR